MYEDSTVIFVKLIAFVLIVSDTQYGATAGQESPSLARRSANVCLTSAQCPQNAHCETKHTPTNGFCVCQKNYALVEAEDADRTHVCVKVAQTLNDSCAHDTQCTVSLSTMSECDASSGVCRCKQGAHYKDGRCYRTSRLGEQCEFSNNCHIPPPTTTAAGSTVQLYCVSGRCACPLRMHPVPRGDGSADCAENAELGERCDGDEQCTDKTARCAGVCRCRIKYVIGRNGTACLPAAQELGDRCTEHAQCSEFFENSICGAADGTCTCERGYHGVDQKCWRTIRLGEQCDDDRQCYIPDRNGTAVAVPNNGGGARCSGGLCACEGAVCANRATLAPASNSPITVLAVALVAWTALLLNSVTIS